MLDKSDRKLLMLAATAVGYLVRADLTYEDGIVIDDGIVWNPLTDDRDALRLAVKLNLPDIAELLRFCLNQDFCMGDPYAATRRAIVKVAAEIGKSLTEE